HNLHTATLSILSYTLSLHDALPISESSVSATVPYTDERKCSVCDLTQAQSGPRRCGPVHSGRNRLFIIAGFRFEGRGLLSRGRRRHGWSAAGRWEGRSG